MHLIAMVIIALFFPVICAATIKVKTQFEGTEKQFGTACAIAGDTILISAQSENPTCYIFSKDKKKWQKSAQSVPVNVNSTLSAQNEWAFVPAADGITVYKRQADEYIKTQVLASAGSICAYDGAEWLLAVDTKISFFRLINDQWSQVQTLTLPDAQKIKTACIKNTHALIAESGSVHAFKLVDRDWKHVQTLKSSTNAEDLFGHAVALTHDWALVAAPLDSERQSGAGACYFYRFEKNQWVEKQKVFSDQPSALFGFDLSMYGNMAVIGDPCRPFAESPFQGAAIVFKKEKNNWKQIDLLHNPSGLAFDFFGASTDICKRKILVACNDLPCPYLPKSMPAKRPPVSHSKPARAVLFTY